MTNRNRISFGLLLLSVTLLLAVSMLPGQAFARYYAGASWNAVIHDTSKTIPILTKTAKTLSIPVEAPENAVCIVEKMQSDGGYEAFASNGVAATLSGENALIALGEDLPPAGTYRLVIRSADGETVLQTVVFFVNYSDG